MADGRYVPLIGTINIVAWSCIISTFTHQKYTWCTVQRASVHHDIVWSMTGTTNVIIGFIYTYRLVYSFISLFWYCRSDDKKACRPLQIPWIFHPTYWFYAMYHLTLIIDDDCNCALTSLRDICLHENVNLHHMDQNKPMMFKIGDHWILNETTPQNDSEEILYNPFGRNKH